MSETDQAALISVMIGAYNAAPYLGEAIESVFAQTQRPLELIVVDDGSDDGTGDVARSYGDRLTLVRQERGGNGAARNTAVAQARGDFFAFLDADDRFTPAKLALQLAALRADPELDVVFGHVREFVSPELTPEQRKLVRPPAPVSPWAAPNLMLIRRESFERVRYLRQPTRSGASEARNVGVAAAQGEFVAFVDADDVVPPTKLAVQVGHLLEHPQLACVLGRQHWMNPPSGLARDVVWGDLDGIPILSAVFRTNVLRELGLFDEEKGGDLDMLVRLREAGLSFTVLPDIVLHRRYHGGNLVAGRGLTPLPPISLKEKLARERARRAQEQNA